VQERGRFISKEDEAEAAAEEKEEWEEEVGDAIVSVRKFEVPQRGQHAAVVRSDT
jgi:DNA-binding transcriptional regulator YhcF (GntR family)